MLILFKLDVFNFFIILFKIHSLGIILYFYIFISVVTSAAEYYGKYLGPLKSYHHGLGGDVYAVDARTLHIRNFVYDGEGPGNHYFILFRSV